MRKKEQIFTIFIALETLHFKVKRFSLQKSRVYIYSYFCNNRFIILDFEFYQNSPDSRNLDGSYTIPNSPHLEGLKLYTKYYIFS